MFLYLMFPKNDHKLVVIVYGSSLGRSIKMPDFWSEPHDNNTIYEGTIIYRESFKVFVMLRG